SDSRGVMTARSRSKFIDPPVAEYALDHSSGPDAVQLELQRVTAEQTGNAAGMQIGDDQAVLLEILVRATGARRAVEVGTFTGYADYYEELLPRLRPAGLLLVDNTLWGGAVLDQKDDSDDTVAIRALNDRIAADPRVRVVLLPIGDGLTIAQRL